MVTVEQVEIYDQNGKTLGVLDNAGRHRLRAEAQRPLDGFLRAADRLTQKRFLSGAQSRPTTGWQPRLGVYRIIGIPSGEMTAQAGTYHLQRGACDGDAAG